MNLLKALEGLSVKPEGTTQAETPAESAPKRTAASEQKPETPNVMANLIERHERISNRVRNKS